MLCLRHAELRRLRSFDSNPEVIINGVPLVEGLDYKWNDENDSLLFCTFKVESFDMLVVNPRNLLTHILIKEEVLSVMVFDCELEEVDE